MISILRRVAAAVILCLAAAPAGAQFQKDRLVIDMPADAGTLDPHLQWDTDSYMVYRNIFDNLVTRDRDGRIVPQVASAWRYIDDKTIEFTIRQDIVFHDGTPLTVEDVLFSVRRILDPRLKSPQLTQYDQIASVEATGPATLVMRLRATYAPLLSQLVKLSVVPKAHVEKVGDQAFNQAPVGSGPYRLKDWKKGIGSELEANPGYWGGRPPFGAVSFRVVPDLATRVADLRTGRADLARAFTPDQAETIAADPKLKVLSGPTERLGYLFLNPQLAPTDDPVLRRAIALAIDRKTIIEALLKGFAHPVDILLTPASFGFVADVRGHEYNPAKARELIRAGGYEGRALSFLLSPVYDGRVAQAIQQMLGDVGLKVEITMMDQPTFIRRRLGRADEAGHMSLGRWACACQDADGMIYPMFRTGSAFSKYSNPAFDREVDAARATIDADKRIAHYRRAFEILNADVASVPLYQDFASCGLAGLQDGHGLAHGAGLFPDCAGWILFGFGVISTVRSFLTDGDRRWAASPGRSWRSSPVGVLAFGVLIGKAGLIFALPALVVISALASEQSQFDLKALLVLVGLTAFCIMVFVKGLGVPMPIFGSWFDGVVPPSWQR
jgi:peptide/nickel transport system substrate-binding protein